MRPTTKHLALPLLLAGCSWITAEEFEDRLDLDGDGYAAEKYGGKDCDDRNADMSPGVPEICNGQDDDCDKIVDEGCGTTTGTPTDTGTLPTTGTTTGDPCLVGPELYGESENCPVGSCAELLALRPGLPDDIYVLELYGTGSAEQYWCDMTTDGGGWTQIYKADYEADPCPSSWTNDPFDSTLCIRPDPAPLLQTFSSMGIAWNDLQIRTTMYQYGQPDAFNDPLATDPTDLFVDGLVFMADDGTVPQHLFTYAVGASQDYNVGLGSVCPYIAGTAAPLFVGSAYACGSARTTTQLQQNWSPTSLFDDQPSIGTLGGPPVARDIWAQLFSHREGPPDTEDVGVARLELLIR